MPSPMQFLSQPWNDRGNLPWEIRRWDVAPGVEAPVSGRSSSRRSTSDKTSQAIRNRQVAALIRIYGRVCWLCGRPIPEVPWPDPWSFTRDHVVPRSKGGTGDIKNLRPAHKVCNESRGNSPKEEAEQ